MLNLRKLKQDFSSSILREGKTLFDESKVLSAKILHIDTKTLKISAQVLGKYKNTYESEIEIDRIDSETIDSDCDCPYHYDCQHLAAVLFYLEASLDDILVTYSKETNIEEESDIDDDEKEELLEVVKQATTKRDQRKDEEFRKELLDEYISASKVLANSPFFLPREKVTIEPAELAIIFSMPERKKKGGVEFQIALRLPSRSKPLHIPVIKNFLESVRHKEPQYIGGKRYCFSVDSFNEMEKEIAQIILDHAVFKEPTGNERLLKFGGIDLKTFGMMLAKAYEKKTNMMNQKGIAYPDDELPTLPCLFETSFESPLHFSPIHVGIHVNLEYIQPPSSKILLNPILITNEEMITLEDASLLDCARPGMIYDHVYYRFAENITRQHLKNLHAMRDITVPEPLFGTFIENAIPELGSYASIEVADEIDEFVTFPFVGTVEAVCDLSFLDGELDAKLQFKYNDQLIPASAKQLTFSHLESFQTDEGIVARNLVDEKKIIENLFRDFLYDSEYKYYVSKSEKKIIEFMTDVIPRYQDRVTFNCPQNLLDQFIYDKSEFKLQLSDTKRMDVYQIKMEVKGALKGVKIDRLWDCIVSNRTFIELDLGRGNVRKSDSGNKIPKILVLDLEVIGNVIQLFDELGIEKLDNHTLERPLWSIANIDANQFKGLPVKFSMTTRLKDIRRQMLGEKVVEFSPIPKNVKADLRKYQLEGIHWLERLRTMYLNGILADDMGLGKTLQAIVAITQMQEKKEGVSLVVCPTSLLYNWKEEIVKFNSKLNVLVIDGMPSQRKKMIAKADKYDLLITSYSLLQKDIELYDSQCFASTILDEAQHIKNRGTRNAKSVKLIKSKYRMVLSGTPIENSLDELWSLFDFLMPGFLNSYERFIEKYIRVSGEEQTKNLQYLRKKVAPFIMRRMKADVLDDLPPVSELTYHCQLTHVQRELYKSYAESARNELTKLVERDGFDKVQIHVLATLTRLKQICCHPAIFAKEIPEPEDSAKYDMLQELLQTLIEGNHKTVIFSQYTRMLQIMKGDLESKGIRFSYLDGSSKNRLEIVKEFNADKTIPVFLVSLKAGGTGLNLVGADTVIHYDMWWNPAVENQATDRVHRIGQKQNVSVYKLVTKGTIEEKIVEMQKRKKGIVKKIVSCDDEAITKLSWEDVLELLQT